MFCSAFQSEYFIGSQRYFTNCVEIDTSTTARARDRSSPKFAFFASDENHVRDQVADNDNLDQYGQRSASSYLPRRVVQPQLRMRVGTALEIAVAVPLLKDPEYSAQGISCVHRPSLRSPFLLS